MATAPKHVGAKSKIYNTYNRAFVGTDSVCCPCYYHALDKYCKADHIKRARDGRTEHRSDGKQNVLTLTDTKPVEKDA